MLAGAQISTTQKNRMTLNLNPQEWNDPKFTSRKIEWGFIPKASFLSYYIIFTLYVVRFATRYHLYNLKNVKNTQA